MSSTAAWAPSLDWTEFDARLENAYRRVCGSVGYDITKHQRGSRALIDAATDAWNSGSEGRGPTFMRLGSAIMDAGDFKLGPGLSLKEVSNEILREFFAEGCTVFELAKTSIGADASRWLLKRGLDERSVSTLLGSAEGTFQAPSADRFSELSRPYLEGVLPPLGTAVGGAIVVFAVTMALVRLPHLALGGALLGGGAGYFMGRKKISKRALAMLNSLPRDLYQGLRQELESNLNRFSEVVNRGHGELLGDGPRP